MLTSTRCAAAFVTLVAAIAVHGQYSVGPLGPPVSIARPEGADVCSRTWYDADVFVMPNDSDLGLLAQSTAPNLCAAGTADAIQGARFSGASGLWTTPGLADGEVNVCPVLKGKFTRCDFDFRLDAGPIGSPSVVRLPHENSATGYRYYMAFVGGNSDYIHGKIYWATSDDGEQWVVYSRNATEYWAPIIYANYLRSATSPRSAPACERPSGIGQVHLAFENGLFYMFITYEHPVQPECLDRESAACASSPWSTYDRALTSLAFRFDYDPRHPFGFGPSVRELFVEGEWQRHSGKLTWRYDVDAAGNQLPPDGENPVLEAFNGIQAAGFAYGAGDIEYGGGEWLRLYVFGDRLFAQTTETLDATLAHWSEPQVVDVSRVREAYPAFTVGPAPGLWYGALEGAAPRWWTFIPVATERLCGTTERPNPYAGLSIVQAPLCTPETACD